MSILYKNEKSPGKLSDINVYQFLPERKKTGWCAPHGSIFLIFKILYFTIILSFNISYFSNFYKSNSISFLNILKFGDFLKIRVKYSCTKVTINLQPIRSYYTWDALCFLNVKLLYRQFLLAIYTKHIFMFPDNMLRSILHFC